MKLILVSPSVPMCAAWRDRFADLPDVEIAYGMFEDIPEFDGLVTAGNAFGLMHGGVDAAVVRFFGQGLMDRVQKRILEDFLGEQPVGTALLVETGRPAHPFLIHAPTMRFPSTIDETDHVYLAMAAALRVVHHHNAASGGRLERLAGDEGPTKPRPPIRTLVCPALGVGTGEMAPRQAARQMALAYRYFLEPPTTLDLPLALGREEAIRYGRDCDGPDSEAG